MPISAALVRELAHECGFELVRFGPADPGPHGQHFLDWLAQGRNGEMHYLEANKDRILDPGSWRPGVRSAIALGVDYGGPRTELNGGGQVARYASGRDYHRFLRDRVFALRQRLEREGVPYGSCNGGADAVPVLERALAVRAGIGFLAKSAMVISPTHGPYLQLGELLTGLDLPPDGPASGTCGTCTACLDACPTGAIVAPHQVDARRCLSYTTIELRGFASRELREAQGDRFFGCDVCLEVCPFHSRSPLLDVHGEDRPRDLRPHQLLSRWNLVEVLALDETRYEKEWVGTAMRRATRSGLRRNAAVVLGNLGDENAAPALAIALGDEDPVVRGHAAWALGRIDRSHPALDRARVGESDPRVRDEIEHALAGT
ncbi:MAG: tRNA epoxyqueuosine(34) reductase QueG [Planctomycetota bacterium]